MSLPENRELARIREEYTRRDTLGLSSPYRYENPAFLYHMQEREREILGMLRKEGILLADSAILEVGCGSGHILQRFREFGVSRAWGIDLMENRLRMAASAFPNLRLVLGNAGQLPFADNVFDFVTNFMCLSSVLDRDLRRKIADEMWRVLKPGGTIIYYDLRPAQKGGSRFRKMFRRMLFRENGAPAPSPAHHAPTPISPLDAAEVKELFGRGSMRLRAVSLDFELAGLEGRSHVLASIAALIPSLRTHYLALIRKPR